MGDDRLGAAAEKAQEIVDQPPLRGVARDGGFEDVRVADLLQPADRLLSFEPVDHRLHRGVGGTVFLGKRFLNLAHRRGAARPERLHYLQFQLRQSGEGHWIAPIRVVISTTRVGGSSTTSWDGARENCGLPISSRWAARRDRRSSTASVPARWRIASRTRL